MCGCFHFFYKSQRLQAVVDDVDVVYCCFVVVVVVVVVVVIVVFVVVFVFLLGSFY